MSPETLRSLEAFVLVRTQVREALEVAHRVGLISPPARASYYEVADLLTGLDERGIMEFGRANYLNAVTEAERVR